MAKRRSPASGSRSRSKRQAARSACRRIRGEKSMDAIRTTRHQQTEVGRLRYEVKRVIVGQDHMLERIIVGLLARGHLLAEGVPGLAKTLAIKTVAGAVHGDFKRIQFTPDLVPADLVGTRIYNHKNGDFQTSLGPVFTNLLLPDDINHAPAKVQSALLQAMHEPPLPPRPHTHP